MERKTSIKKREDNELGIPMRIVAASLSFFGWKFIYFAVTKPEEYLEQGVNFQTTVAMLFLVAVLILLTIGALTGKVPKKITDVAQGYDNQKK
jgi:hypothetical protein